MTGRRHDEADEAYGRLAQARPPVSEAHALCYALVMALASTSHERFTRREIDALCQVASEMLDKLGKALECLGQVDEG